ncbi:hypothetical protein DOY81_009089, partial [Sarcophaga bullata]
MDIMKTYQEASKRPEMPEDLKLWLELLKCLVKNCARINRYPRLIFICFRACSSLRIFFNPKNKDFECLVG